MKPLVIDASVAIKWFIPEQGSDKAIRLLDSKRPLIAPDLIRPEIANILWKLKSRRLLKADLLQQMLADFLAMPLDIYDSQPFIQAAFDLAVETGRTVYDSLYLALAIGTNGTLVTADKRLTNALTNTEYKSFIRLIE